MRFEKTVIHRMNMPYAIGTLGAGPSASVVCATEDYGPAVQIAPPYREARTLVPGPGGCMALVPDTERPGELFAVMGCFLGYKFQGGGVYRIRDGEQATRLLDLPFAHRIGLVTRGGARYLLAANLAEDKKDAADWSKPGGVIAARLEGDGGAAVLTAEPVLTGLHKNHGFLLANLEGRRTLLVGAAEGLFAVDLDWPGKSWTSRQVLSQEISEMALFDLDGDGKDELVTIEPFHGNMLRAYRRTAGSWTAFWDSQLEYGHCVLAGMFDGQRSIVVSNRAGSRSLLLFKFGGDGPAKPQRIVVEDGAGAANMLVLTHEGRDRIFSANQAAGEIVMYTPQPVDPPHRSNPVTP